MELGPAETVFGPPHHPYTEALLSAVPTRTATERARIRLEGEIPSPADPPSGCVFHTRCPRNIGDICESEEPPLDEVEPGHFWRCHFPVEELRELQRRRRTRDASRRREPRGRRMGRPEDPRRGARAASARRSSWPSSSSRRRAPGEVLVRLHASGVCHSDLNAIDGTAETRCPAVLGHEGAGVVEAVGPGVGARAPGTHVVLSWMPACGALRGVPARPAAPLRDGLAGDGHTAGCWTARRGSRATASRSTTTRSSPRSPSAPSCPRAAACRSPTTCRSTSPRSSAAR